MGGCLSCKTSISSPKSRNIRIVHLNGYLEEIGYPVTVAQVTAKPTTHFVFTQAQLLAPAPKPLNPETPLEPGRVYFLLPFSLFDANVSPVDLAPVVRKLSSVARSQTSKSKKEEVSPKSSKTKSWKPILSTIRERSFNRTESSVQEDTNIH